MARGQANLAVMEVEEHLPAVRGGGSVLHMIAVVLDDVHAGAPLVAVRNKSWVLVDKGPGPVLMDYTHATTTMALSPMRFSQDVHMRDVCAT